MKISVIVVLVLSFLLASISFSCAPVLPELRGYSENWRFYDIQIPQDCDYIERDSWTYVEPTWPAFRMCHGVFEGQTRRDAVAYAYRRDLGRRGYNILEEMNSELLGTTKLAFYHPVKNELVKIQIQRFPNSIVRVVVNIEPR